MGSSYESPLAALPGSPYLLSFISYLLSLIFYLTFCPRPPRVIPHYEFRIPHCAAARRVVYWAIL
jgi:hypothetical protein